MENIELLENQLRDMNYRDRLNAIADDLISGKDRYCAIDPHQLAEFAGLTPPPLDDSWTRIYYANRMGFEELIDNHDAEIVFRYAAQYLKGKVDAAMLARVEDTLVQYENGNYGVDISFLTAKEKELIEVCFMERELDELDGGYVVARTCIGSPKGVELWFEGDIEDDGDCIEIRTPYDYRDGKFTNTGPITEAVLQVPWGDNFSDAVH
jgi:hypothetical protein